MMLPIRLLLVSRVELEVLRHGTSSCLHLILATNIILNQERNSVKRTMNNASGSLRIGSSGNVQGIRIDFDNGSEISIVHHR